MTLRGFAPLVKILDLNILNYVHKRFALFCAGNRVNFEPDHSRLTGRNALINLF